MSKPLEDAQPLTDPKHEKFAVLVAQGKSHRDAAIAAGFKGKFVSATGSKLAKAAKIRQRIDYLKTQVAEKTVAKAAKLVDLEIASKQQRCEVYADIFQRILTVLNERAADKTMANVPGGRTGLVVRQIKAVGIGKDQKIVPEYVVDTGTLRELRATAEQAAKELGQWSEKLEHTGKDGKPIEVKEVADLSLIQDFLLMAETAKTDGPADDSAGNSKATVQ